MSHRGIEDQFIELLLPRSLENLSVLDIGSGLGKTGFNFRTLYGLDRGQAKIYGIEVFEKYWELLINETDIYNNVYLGNAADPKIWEKLPGPGFDIIIGQQVLEHNDKEEALKIIKLAEKHSRGILIFCLPYRGSPSDPNKDNNPYSRHRSSWDPQDLRELGYTTKIINEKPYNSRAVDLFARIWYALRGVPYYPPGVIVAYKIKTLAYISSINELIFRGELEDV